MDSWKQYQDAHKEEFLAELIDLLKIPSISARSENKADMLHCAEVVKQRLVEAGADTVTIYPTQGHPIVYAEKIIDPSKPTVLVYGHYDVQPADPLELWHSGPFEPVIKDGKIYARGSADDKGQFYMHVKALETFTKTNSFCTNIKFLIEGEEEIGSPNLAEFVKANKELLKADVILISDTSMLSMENPSIDIGVRGLSYIEVEITAANRDLHSGVYGGAVANPITILAQMIASCHDENNHITIPGFYDDVVEATPAEREKMAKAPFDELAYKTDLGITELWGEKGFTTNERTGIRPTLEVNGIWGGYTGEGAKTVLPSKATAKISCRLVPNQSSSIITKKVLDYFHSIAPAGVTVKAAEHHGGEPYMTPIDSIEYKAAAKAVETCFGKEPIPVRGGGSIPICALFEKELGLKIVFLGFGLDSDNLHSPNEKYNLENYYKGIETIPYFHHYFAEMKQ
ncbi:MAG: peptidase dimerization domain protein [Sphingobacteriia bacterium 24-36-13]|jgi:acetylornithine deacetylase/succinyl-diaminopimelate desuccinylase-like protein|uniref:dipeptidase n=1 Tax=Sediminibacterium sp. TaxID=1917865 RepID=UPI000BCE3A0E|nr:dipeptidase [Sediminibacterium sp.]OYY10152.1 MAG: peptidase dimerization domain protein [Sphingobacteriia bacterium 35-36-14]OYZ54602.1 MAG: peptidase dimerization domain protein [Sphingobacteriia bacterium 24-36-13]OZA63356.1 MAG: peptidase dimerization domain protein [Sphingobacteriia bacterium 39-36-14]HQS23690.1 dipeptidase [Sediminibacterium sp.]HQS34171.1 dipeptidase [Sediminibacterium sp.]